MDGDRAESLADEWHNFGEDLPIFPGRFEFVDYKLDLTSVIDLETKEARGEMVPLGGGGDLVTSDPGIIFWFFGWCIWKYMGVVVTLEEFVSTSEHEHGSQEKSIVNKRVGATFDKKLGAFNIGKTGGVGMFKVPVFFWFRFATEKDDIVLHEGN